MENLKEFEIHGFLNTSSLGVPQHVAFTYGKYLKIFGRINKIAWGIQYNASPPKSDIVKSWSYALYARTLNFIQSAYMLSSTGLRVQAETQLRCSLEPLFRLGALKNNPEFIRNIDLAERKDRLKQGNSYVEFLNRKKPKNKPLIKRLKSQCKDQKEELILLLKEVCPDLFEKYDDDKALSKFSLPVFEIADKAGLIDWYDLMYRLGSASIHSDAKSIEDGHFILNESGEIKALKNEPELEELDEFINTLCAILFCAIELISANLDIESPKAELEKIKDELDKLEPINQDAGSTP